MFLVSTCDEKNEQHQAFSRRIVIVFQGNVIGRPGTTPGSLASPSFFTQMVEIIDAETGDAVAERIFGGQGELDIKNLAALQLPKQLEEMVPTIPVRTAVPLPTLEPNPTINP